MYFLEIREQDYWRKYCLAQLMKLSDMTLACQGFPDTSDSDPKFSRTVLARPNCLGSEVSGKLYLTGNQAALIGT